MGLFSHFGSIWVLNEYNDAYNRSTDIGSLIATQVLNTRECGVAAVGLSLTGKLCFRKRGGLCARTSGIDHVRFLRSYKVRGRVYRYAVEAFFNIYLTTGEVIKVFTDDRKVIKAALKYAPTDNIRPR